MQQEIILISLAILPVIVLAFFIYRKDKFNKEPLDMLVKAFAFGCLSVFPAGIIEGILSSAYSMFGGDYLPGAVSGAYTGFVVAGCTEELCKLLFLMLAVRRSAHFDEYFDGIVYATFVSLGFAGLENVMYVFNQETFAASIMTGSMRAVLSVPAHFLFGVVMGYYYALYRFQPEDRGSNLFKAFFFPMLLHGTYDSLLMIPEAMGANGELLAMIFFVVFIYFDVKLWKIGMRRLRKLQDLSAGQQTDSANDDSYGNGGDAFTGFNWDV